MRKKIIFILVVIAGLLVLEFRNEIMFQFQYARLQGLSCKLESEGMTLDTCLNKIWPHRVNSIERYKKLQGQFIGYETDIVWDNKINRFLVYHPPLEHEPITLDSFFAVVNNNIESFWLDAREIQLSDTTNVLAALNALDEHYGLKLGAIIEVYDVAVANFLANKGYWISLNINTSWIEKYTDADWKKLNESLSPRISFVSQEDIHIPLLKKHFPAKDIITWAIAFKNYFNMQHLQQLVKDDKVKVILVNIKSRYYQ